MKKKLEELASEKSQLFERIEGKQYVGVVSECIQSLGLRKKTMPRNIQFRAVEYDCDAPSCCDY